MPLKHLKKKTLKQFHTAANILQNYSDDGKTCRLSAEIISEMHFATGAVWSKWVNRVLIQMKHAGLISFAPLSDEPFILSFLPQFWKLLSL